MLFVCEEAYIEGSIIILCLLYPTIVLVPVGMGDDGWCSVRDT